MSPALIRSALLTLTQAVALAACSTTQETKYHLVPEPSRGALIASAASSPVRTPSAMLRTQLSVDQPSSGETAIRFAGT